MVAHSSQLSNNTLNASLSSDRRTAIQSRSDLSTSPSVIGAYRISTLTTPPEQTFISSTHWSSILESTSAFRDLIEARTDKALRPSPPASPSHEIDIVFGPQPGITIEQAVARLPPKEKMDQLVLMYFRHPFIMAPYIHTFKFQKEYNDFWMDPSSVNLLWVSTLSSILCSVALLARLKGENSSKDYDAAHENNLAKLAVECLVAGDYLAVKPYSLEALLLHAFTDLQKNRHYPSKLWAKVGLLVRLAHRMSYHRDPKCFPSISPFEGELRRRVWFYIEMLDCIVSFHLGLPPSIRENECDTESPGKLHDLDFEENCVMLPLPRPPTEPTSTLYLCIKAKLCRKLRCTINISMSITPPLYQEVMRLHNQIERYHDSIPQSLKIRPIRSYSFADHNHDVIHRLTIEMLYLKSLCILHRKYFNTEKYDFRYEPSRRTSVNAAIRILDLHARYEEEYRPGSQLSGDRYMLTSLGLHDFLVAAMILYLNLSDNAPSSQEEHAKKLRVLDTSYKIWSENKIVSRETAHATKIVGAILHKVSTQESSKASFPPTRPAVRSGSLHVSTPLNNGNQLPQLSATVPLCQSKLSNVMDESLEVLDLVSLDNVIKGISQNDWTTIDRMVIL